MDNKFKEMDFILLHNALYNFNPFDAPTKGLAAPAIRDAEKRPEDFQKILDLCKEIKEMRNKVFSSSKEDYLESVEHAKKLNRFKFELVELLKTFKAGKE